MFLPISSSQILGSMSIADVFSRIVTQKNENKKNFRHIEITIFTTFFVNRFFRTRYEKKVNSH